MPVSRHVHEFLRILFLTGVAFAPMAAAAQDAAVPLPVSVAPPPDTVLQTPPPDAAPQTTPATAAPQTPAGAATPANPAAQNPPEQVRITAPRTTGVAAIVNDFVISDYDLDQRTALFVATSGIAVTKDTIQQIRGQVLRSLEDEILELQEATKHKITASKTDVDKALQNIAEDNHLTTDQILDTIKKAGVTPETFRQQIAAQIIWQKLVAARYGTDILINDQQIAEAMQRLKLGADKPQFLISEIFLAVDRPEDETTVRTSAEQIVQQLNQRAPFATVAGQFSQSPSAADGGDIGWVLQGQLADDLDHALAALRPGDIAGPIRAEGGYYVLQLRDRREPLGTKVVAPVAPPPADPNAALPLDRLLIPLPPNPDAMIKERAMLIATNIKTQVRSCTDLPIVAKQLEGTVYTRLGNMSPKDLNPELRDALAKTGPGEVVTPFYSAAGLEVIMRCDPAPPKLVAFELPSKEQLQQQLFVQQMSIFAKSYLRDLRRDAVVETR
jgi:peptidyl-prolyl cis-trans isomerase SurA